jgi:hypothetical protein
MHRFDYVLVIGLVAAGPLVGGCQKPDGSQAHQEHPAKVEHIEGSAISKITLTARAIERLDVQTGAVTEEKSPRAETPQKAIPHSALWYDPQGNTWVYTSPEDRVFVRAAVMVDHIINDVAYLTDGPEIGTSIATVAVAELYGTEFEVGH